MKTALITGCSSGIGYATARTFLDDDWVVYATARDTADLAELEERGCETAALDVTDDDQCAAVVDRIVEEQGRIDCLVNNAGYGQVGPIEDVPTRLVERQFDVNVFGPHRLIREVLPHMRERGEGRIVTVSSGAGLVSLPGTGVYSASKFAVEGHHDALRNEVDAYGIDVCLVEPGPVATEFDDRAERELDKLDRSGAYEPVYRFYRDSQLFGSESTVASHPREVADTILEAAVVPEPKARYPVGAVGYLAVLSRHLPDRLTDTTYRLLERLM